jgi:hypothetical protein
MEESIDRDRRIVNCPPKRRRSSDQLAMVSEGSNVTFSNVTLTFGLPASSHFGKQAVHGVVLNCTGPWGRELNECNLQE